MINPARDSGFFHFKEFIQTRTVKTLLIIILLIIEIEVIKRVIQ